MSWHLSNYWLIKCLFSSLFRLTTKKHQRFALLSLYEGIHWWPKVSPHKGTVMWKMFPFDDTIMSVVQSVPNFAQSIKACHASELQNGQMIAKSYGQIRYHKFWVWYEFQVTRETPLTTVGSRLATFRFIKKSSTVRCRYNMVRYNMIGLQARYGEPLLRIWEKVDYVINSTALYSAFEMTSATLNIPVAVCY